MITRNVTRENCYIINLINVIKDMRLENTKCCDTIVYTTDNTHVYYSLASYSACRRVANSAKLSVDTDMSRKREKASLALNISNDDLVEVTLASKVIVVSTT